MPSLENLAYRYKVIVKFISSLDRWNCSTSTGKLGARMTLDIGLKSPAILERLTIPHFCFFVNELKGFVGVFSFGCIASRFCPGATTCWEGSWWMTAVSARVVVGSVGIGSGVRSRTVEEASDSTGEEHASPSCSASFGSSCGCGDRFEVWETVVIGPGD